MTLNGVPRPSQIKRCLLLAFRRSTGDGPVSAPPPSRERGDHPRTPVTSPVHRPRSAWRAAPGGADRRPRPSPPVQTPPAGPSRAEPHHQRQELPGHVIAEDEQDALEAETARHRPRPRRPLRPGQQQRLNQRPSSTIHGRVLTPARTAESSHRTQPTRTLQQDHATSSSIGASGRRYAKHRSAVGPLRTRWFP